LYGRWQTDKQTFDGRDKNEIRPSRDAKIHDAQIQAEISKDRQAGRYGNYDSDDEERDLAPPRPAPIAHVALREEKSVPTTSWRNPDESDEEVATERPRHSWKTEATDARVNQRGRTAVTLEEIASGTGAVSASDSPDPLGGTATVDVDLGSDDDSGYGSCGSHSTSSLDDTEDETARQETDRIENELETDDEGKFHQFILDDVIAESEEEAEDPLEEVSNGPTLFQRNEIPEGTPKFILDHYENFKRDLWSGVSQEDAVSAYHQGEVARRNADTQHRVLKRVHKLNSVIAKRAFRDRLENMKSQQVDLYNKANALIDATEVENAFPAIETRSVQL